MSESVHKIVESYPRFPSVYTWENLLRAWERAESNDGAPGRPGLADPAPANAQLPLLQSRIARLIDDKEDNVRYYRLCRDCLAQTVVVGRVPLAGDPDYWLV